MTEYKVTLDTDKLDEIAGKLQLSLDEVMLGAAYEIEAQAKQIAPYRTGALKNSIATERVNENKIIARVGPHVEYAAYVEFGTSRMAAQPYLKPAAESVAQKYSDPSRFKRITE